jgi:hypothetical protein
MIKIIIRQIFILFLLYQLSVAQSDTSKYCFSEPPIEVITFIKNHYPEYSFPKIIWYTGQNEYINLRLKKIHEETNGFPPYCAYGDFNGDGYTDYICHISYGTVGPSNIYHYRYVLLHGSKEGLKEFPFIYDRLYGGHVACIEEILVSVSPDILIALYPNEIKGYTIRNTAFLISSFESIRCIYWDGLKYQEIYLYA